AVAAGAVPSTAGLFMALLLTNSRLPYVLARAGVLPRGLGALHPRFGTPWPAVLVSAAAYAACAAFSFKALIVLNVWLYSLALLVELAAFLTLRATAPQLPRPWRVPGGRAGALAVTVPPVQPSRACRRSSRPGRATSARSAPSTPVASSRAARPPRSTGRTTTPRSRGQTVTTSRRAALIVLRGGPRDGPPDPSSERGYAPLGLPRPALAPPRGTRGAPRSRLCSSAARGERRRQARGGVHGRAAGFP